MEDTHVWIMDTKGEQRREIGSVIDQRQHGDLVARLVARSYFTHSERGSNHGSLAFPSQARQPAGRGQ